MTDVINIKQTMAVFNFSLCITCWQQRESRENERGRVGGGREEKREGESVKGKERGRVGGREEEKRERERGSDWRGLEGTGSGENCTWAGIRVTIIAHLFLDEELIWIRWLKLLYYSERKASGAQGEVACGPWFNIFYRAAECRIFENGVLFGFTQIKRSERCLDASYVPKGLGLIRSSIRITWYSCRLLRLL